VYPRVCDAVRRIEPDLADHIALRLALPSGRWRVPPLRAYQEGALAAWHAMGRRGIIALPTGSGKTRVAIAALASIGRAALILCPTRVLLEQWRRELANWYDGAVGIVGDGSRCVEDVTVMTFESAYRHLDELGDRFGVLVVDEAHHFASGLRAEALEMCAAPCRLGLTATGPVAGSDGDLRLADLIGPVVCEVSLAELVGTHLAPLEIVRLSVDLTPPERHEYERAHAPFAQLARAFGRAHPGADGASLMRWIGQTAAGRAAIADFRRASNLASFNEAKRLLTSALLARHRGEKVIVFTAHVDDACVVSIENLIPVVTSEVPRKERAEILDGFRRGTYRAIVSARVLNEGVDVPDASVAIICGGELGVREHLQRVGRVLRPAPGKTAIVYELTTARTLEQRRTNARRAGLDPAAAHRR
jgi:superfamily II DNA or RNA helicase